MKILMIMLLMFIGIMVFGYKSSTALAKCQETNPIWNDLQKKYADNPTVQQLVFVKYLGDSDAIVEFYKKKLVAPASAIGDDLDKANAWRMTYRCDAFVGKNGLGKKAEGDNKTPMGDYGIFMAVGQKDNPGTEADFLKIDEHIFCAEGPYYNKLVDDRIIPYSELKKYDPDPMNDAEPQFNYGLFIDYNKECVEGKGCYIFMHCKGNKPYTHGCVALAERDMRYIVRSVDNGVRICIYPATANQA